MEPRIDRWREPIAIEIPFTVGDSDFSEEEDGLADRLSELQREWKGQSEEEILDWFSESGMMLAAHELVFDKVEGQPLFHLVGYGLNVRTGFLELSHSIDILTDGDSEEEIADDIRHTLAIAHMHDVPVMPNTEALSEELAHYYREMMVHGFKAPDEDGEPVRLRLTRSPGELLDSLEFLRRMRLSEHRQPIEFALIRTAVERELGRLSQAQQLLAKLELAIEDLSARLTSDRRNESALQGCLTTHPILFGLHYTDVKSKHRLGSDYEMDYALIRFSGLVDLVEIEASTLPVFTKAGNPSSKLVHAEQQVLDWLEWIERHGGYARENLPGLVDPLGFVVIGRSHDMNEATKKRLAQRNSLFRDKIRILTYDDLLERARHMLKILVGPAVVS